MRWELFKTILWLRWRLSRNQLQRTGAFARVFAVLITFLALGGIVATGIIGYVLGRFALVDVGADKIMYAIDGVILGFLFMWVIGVVVDVQRSETIDLQRLLHLPISLKDAFAVNFAVSHVSLSLGLTVPAIVGLAVGLAQSSDPRWLVLPVLFLTFVYVLNAWTYCLRGWLVQLMVNPRRRRTIIILLTSAIVITAQAPNLFFNVYLRRAMKDKEKAAQLMETRADVIQKAHYFVPPLWVGWGTVQATRGVWWPGLGAMALFAVVGTLGVRRAYRSTLRFYRGDAPPAKPRPAGSVKPERAPALPAAGRSLLERKVPFVSDEVSAATFAFLRCMQRAPEMKMALMGPFLMLAFVGFMFFSRDLGGRLLSFGPLIAIGLTVFALTAVLQILFNQFGWDRHGYRALVLSPVPRRELLLAKNLASGGVVLVLGWLIYLGCGLVAKLPAVALLAGGFQVLSATLILSGAGNCISILLPFRVNTGSLKPTKPPFKVVLVMMVVTLLTPIYLLPVFAGPTAGMLAGIDGSVWAPGLNLLVSVVVCALLAVFYWFSLGPLSRLFVERELRILDTVTAEVE